MHMAYVNVSLSAEAYDRLKRIKLEDESFSQEILRITSANKLWELGGVLSKNEASELEKGVALVRSRLKVREWR